MDHFSKITLGSSLKIGGSTWLSPSMYELVNFTSIIKKWHVITVNIQFFLVIPRNKRAYIIIGVLLHRFATTISLWCSDYQERKNHSPIDSSPPFVSMIVPSLLVPYTIICRHSYYNSSRCMIISIISLATTCLYQGCDYALVPNLCSKIWKIWLTFQKHIDFQGIPISGRDEKCLNFIE